MPYLAGICRLTSNHWQEMGTARNVLFTALDFPQIDHISVKKVREYRRID